MLGHGAMGIVYEGLDPHLARSVAIKTIRTADLAPELVESFERRFQTEARSAARLRHPAIVNVHDAGKDGDVNYLVMELVKGVNLKVCLNHGVRFTPEGAFRIVLDVLSALQHAHGHKIVHRDIKPENILLDATGAIKLTDFGIAKIQEAGMDNGTQVSGMTIGTPRYMSPEQVRGREVDARTDLFSAGVLLYELLTTTLPFDGNSHTAIASRILHDAPPPVTSRMPQRSDRLDALMGKALSKRADDRFQSAAEFQTALRDAAREYPRSDAIAPVQPAAYGALQLVVPDSVGMLKWLIDAARSTQADTGKPPAPTAPPAADPAGATAVLSRSNAQTAPSMTAAPTGFLVDGHAASSPVPVPAAASLERTGLRVLPLALALAAMGLIVLVWAFFPHTSPVAPVSDPAPASAGAAVNAPLPTPEPPGPAQVPASAAGPKTTPVPTLPPPQSPPVATPEKRPGPSAAPTAPASPVSAEVSRKPLPPSEVVAPSASARPNASQSPLSASRCALLLEKAGSGEPLSDAEQGELKSSCR